MARKLKLNMGKRDKLGGIAEDIQDEHHENLLRREVGTMLGEAYDIVNKGMCALVSDDELAVLRKFNFARNIRNTRLLRWDRADSSHGIRVSREGQRSSVFTMRLDDYPMEALRKMDGYGERDLPLSKKDYNRLVSINERISERAEFYRNKAATVTRAYRTLIASCATWEELVEMWPEVEKSQARVFGDVYIPSGPCLTVKTEDDLALVLADQASRGAAA